ncbi:MAG: glycosyltransferase family 4 protein [Nitrospirae bacterium]|nr:glycosyltransferase family 4 protein [Nitrospirota bacterium]
MSGYAEDNIRKLNITFLTREFPPMIGGVGDYIVRLAAKLGSAYKVDVITSNHPEIVNSNMNSTAFYNACPSIKLWNVLGILSFLREISKRKCGIIIFQFTPFMYSKYGFGLYFLIWLLAAKIIYSTKIITTVHETYNSWGNNIKTYSISFLHRFQFLLLGMISNNVVVTTAQREKIARKWFFWKKSDIHCIPVGSNINVFPLEFADKKKFRERVADDSSIIVSTFGLLETGINYEETLNNLALFRLENSNINFKFLIIGGVRAIDSQRKKKIDELIHYLGLDDYLYCTGYQNESRISEFLQITDVFILNRADGPSTRSGTLAAALSHSRPVLANRGSIIDPLFKDGENLLFFNSAEDFRIKLSEIIRDKDLRKQISENGKKLYDSKLDWDVIAGQYFSIIKDHDK